MFLIADATKIDKRLAANKREPKRQKGLFKRRRIPLAQQRLYQINNGLQFFFSMRAHELFPGKV